MLFFKQQKALLQQKKSFLNELYYKLYKLFIIIFKWNKSLAKLITQKKRSFFYRNICIYSKKEKSIQRDLKLSRYSIREFSNKGFFFGLHKLSW